MGECVSQCVSECASSVRVPANTKHVSCCRVLPRLAKHFWRGTSTSSDECCQPRAKLAARMMQLVTIIFSFKSVRVLDHCVPGSQKTVANHVLQTGGKWNSFELDSQERKERKRKERKGKFTQCNQLFLSVFQSEASCCCSVAHSAD